MNISNELLTDGTVTYIIKRFNSKNFNKKYVKDDAEKKLAYFNEIITLFKNRCNEHGSKCSYYALKYDLRYAFKDVYGDKYLIEMFKYTREFKDNNNRLCALDYVIGGHVDEILKFDEFKLMVELFEEYTGITLPSSKVTPRLVHELIRIQTNNSMWWGENNITMALSTYFGRIVITNDSSADIYTLYTDLYNAGRHNSTSSSRNQYNSFGKDIRELSGNGPSWNYRYNQRGYNDPNGHHFNELPSADIYRLMKDSISTMNYNRPSDFSRAYLIFTALYGSALNRNIKTDSMEEIATILIDKMKERKLIKSKPFIAALNEGYECAIVKLSASKAKEDKYLSAINDVLKSYRMENKLSR